LATVIGVLGTKKAEHKTKCYIAAMHDVIGQIIVIQVLAKYMGKWKENSKTPSVGTNTILTE